MIDTMSKNHHVLVVLVPPPPLFISLFPFICLRLHFPSCHSAQQPFFPPFASETVFRCWARRRRTRIIHVRTLLKSARTKDVHTSPPPLSSPLLLRLFHRHPTKGLVSMATDSREVTLFSSVLF